MRDHSEPGTGRRCTICGYLLSSHTIPCVPTSPPVSGETEEVSAKPCPDTHPDTGDPCVIPLRPSGMPHVWRHFNGKRNGKWVEWSDEWASSVRRFAISRLESRVTELTTHIESVERENEKWQITSAAFVADAHAKLAAVESERNYWISECQRVENERDSARKLLAKEAHLNAAANAKLQMAQDIIRKPPVAVSRDSVCMSITDFVALEAALGRLAASTPVDGHWPIDHDGNYPGDDLIRSVRKQQHRPITHPRKEAK